VEGVKKIGRADGERFPDNITSGEASDVIAARFSSDPAAAHAHRRAARKRDRPDRTAAG
jgi:hypothetical protein